MRPPEVSVVLGVRDAGVRAQETVRSVLAQSLRDLECIVVDDGSRDATARRLRRVAGADRRVRIVRQAAAGLTRALITGCAEARAPFIARVDAGDRMLPGRLAAQVAWLRAHPDVVVLGSALRLVGPEGEALDVPGAAADTPGERDLTADFASAEPARLAGLAHMTVCLRRDAYHRAGGYRAAFRLAQDTDLWTRMAAIGRLVRVGQVLTEARVSLDGLSPRHHRTQLALRALAAACSRARRDGRDEAPLLARADALGRRALAGGGRSDGAALFVAGCLARRGDAAAAERYFRIARRAAPLDPRAVAGLARVRVRRWLAEGGGA